MKTTLLFCLLIIGCVMSIACRTETFKPKAANPKSPYVAMWSGPNLTLKDGEWIQWDPESPDDVTYFVNRCAEGGIDRIYPSLGKDLYHSQILQTGDLAFDPLEILVNAAHNKGIEVHPYLAVFYNGEYFVNMPKDVKSYMSKSRDGIADLRFLSPAYLDVRKRMVDVYMELLENYDIDGIMLDYVRYHKADRGYDTPIIEAFKAQGGDCYQVPNDDPAWVQARAEFVTKFVHEMRAAMKAKGIDKPLSVSAICNGNGTTRETLFDVYQDLQTWADQGLVDVFCPMAYTKDLKVLRKQITNFVKDIKSRNRNVKVFASVAPYQDRLCTPELLEAGAKIVLESGADGICIYRGSSMEKYDLWRSSNKISNP